MRSLAFLRYMVLCAAWLPTHVDAQLGGVDPGKLQPGAPDNTTTSAASNPSDHTPPIGDQAEPARTSDARWEQARTTVERGEALFRNGDFEGALVHFNQAYDQLAGHPRQYIVLHNLALCHERLFRYDEAVRLYELYLREGGPNAEDRAGVAAVLSALRGLLATVHVDSNVAGEVWIDDRRLGDLPATLQVPAGRHLLEVRARLYETARRELQLRARMAYRIRLDLEPLSDFRGIDRRIFFASAALTLALGVTTSVLGARTLDLRQAALVQRDMALGFRTPTLDRQQERIGQAALVTDVTLAGTLLVAATTLVLFFLTDWKPDERKQARSVASKRSPLSIAISSHALMLRAAFL